VHRHSKVTLPVLLRAMSTRPAQRLGIAGGTLAQGAPAEVLTEALIGGLL